MSKFKNTNYCPSCYEAKVKEVNDREHLYKMLQKLFNVSFPTGMMLKQINTFREEHGYTYRNIAFTVDYIVNIKKITMQRQYGM